VASYIFDMPNRTMPVLYSQPFFAGSMEAGFGHVAMIVSANRTPQFVRVAGRLWLPPAWSSVAASTTAKAITTSIRGRNDVLITTDLQSKTRPDLPDQPFEHASTGPGGADG
jgi:hypothetical protein